MKRILTAVVLIPVVLLVVFKAPLWVFGAVTALFALIAAYEYLNLAQVIDAAVPVLPGVAHATLIFAWLTVALRSQDDRVAISSTAVMAVLLLLYPLEIGRAHV